MKITFITEGVSGGTDTNTWRPVTAGGNTLTGAPSGETLAFTAGTGIAITESGGAVTITNSVANTNTNIANANLTLDNDRTTSLNEKTLSFNNEDAQLLSFPAGTRVQIGNLATDDSYVLPLTRPSDTQVLTASGTGGNIVWATPAANTNTWRPVTAGGNTLTGAPSGETLAFTAGTGIAITESGGAVTITNSVTNTDTNVALNNLSMTDGSKTTDVGANTLTFDSGTTNIIQLIGSDDTLSIGGANPYKMPTAKASAQYKALVATNASGGTDWQALTAAGGAMTMFYSGTASTWASGSYGWFKKNGGGMHIDTDLNISGAGAVPFEMFIWNAALIPTSWKFVGKRDAGVAGGLTGAIYFDTPNTGATNITWNAESNFASGLLATNSANWQTHSGTFAAGNFANASDGDFFSFAFLAEDALAGVSGFFTIYYSSAIQY